GAGTDWGTEEHHSDYETYVNQRTSSYDADFNVYLSFDGELDLVSAYDAARELAYDTTFDVDGDLTCVWMDQNYNWSDSVFKDRCGESLNLAVNYLTNVLHTLYSEAVSVHNIDTGLDYLTIQEAIDAPETLDGHTILVGTGTYYEHVVLDKSASLIGENRTGTVIDGNGTGTLMWITANSVTISGFTFCNSGHDYGDCGILIENSQGNNVANNIITNNLYGIRLVNSTNISLTDNVASENAVAVYLCNSSCNEITRNNIDFANNSCIALWQESDNNIIRYNSISHSNCTGIYTNNSDNNTIVFNNMSFNEGGIYLRESNYNILISNNIITSILTGLALRNITDSKIYSNTIAHNPYGIYSANISNNIFADNTIADNEYCVLLKHSYDNVFYHNNFINTYFQVWSVNRNSWDNDLEGNYWNDYEGKDLDNDGIGDTPHFIDVNNKDNYPLMGSFSDFNVTSEYLFQTVCSSSISDFQFNGTAIRLNVSGENGTTGFCRICIPTALMNATYKVFANGTEVPYTLLPCSNSTHSYLYFTYNHSTQEVIIIPEFPTWSSIFLVLIILTFAIVICKRRLPKTLRLFCCS
ncbi:MAG: right-handed parallel beta-helix repeat-containing protein, partial [Candidatus Bathyarchaeota archaeon]|nr:right-handed parallel beta-helix repeat-containing protein [Candidatus Bathyarchaeota archaeon]